MARDGVMPDGEWPRPKPTRPWSCRRDDATCTRAVPCNSCRGARNRRSGMKKQRDARKAIEQGTGTIAARFTGQLGNEEAWSGLPFRVEVKSGGLAKPVKTFYDKCAVQSESNHAIGDPRPFVAIAMPAGGRMLWVIDNEFMLRFIEAWVNA